MTRSPVVASEVRVSSVSEVGGWLERYYGLLDSGEVGELREASRRGSLIVVKTEPIIWLEGPGKPEGIYGPRSLGEPIDTDSNVVDRIVRVADRARILTFPDILGDLRRTGVAVRLWDLFSAPYSITLDERVMRKVLRE